MTIDEVLAEGKAAIEKRDREHPLSDAARWAVALDLGIEFERREKDDRDRIQFGQDEDPGRLQDTEPQRREP